MTKNLLSLLAPALLAGLLAACSNAATPPTSSGLASQMVGAWTNDTPDGGVPKVGIRTSGDQIFVHGYGVCHPDFCDWGEAATSLSEAQDGDFTVRWTFSFKTTTMTLSRTDAHHLTATIVDDYSAADGRTDRVSSAVFHN